MCTSISTLVPAAVQRIHVNRQDDLEQAFARVRREEDSQIDGVDLVGVGRAEALLRFGHTREIRSKKTLREGPVYIGREVSISLREVRVVVDPHEDQRKVLRQS